MGENLPLFSLFSSMNISDLFPTLAEQSHREIDLNNEARLYLQNQ